MYLLPDNKWARLLAYVTGLFNQKLLLQNDYLAAENRILRATFPPVCAFPIPSAPLSLRSVSDWAALRFSRWPVSPNPIPSSLGTAGSLPANSTAPNTAPHRADPRPRPKSKRLLSALPERTPAGDTTTFPARWPISATPFPIR